jgi:hypothetical protein
VFIIYRTNVMPPHSAFLDYRLSDRRALTRGKVKSDRYILTPIAPGMIRTSLSYFWSTSPGTTVRGRTKIREFACRPGDVVVLEVQTLLQHHQGKAIIKESHRANVVSGALALLLQEQYRAGDNINIEPFLSPPPPGEDFRVTQQKLKALRSLRQEKMVSAERYIAQQNDILTMGSGIVTEATLQERAIRSAMEKCGYPVEFGPNSCTLGQRVIDKVISHKVVYKKLSSVRLIGSTVIEIVHKDKRKDYFAFPKGEGDLARQVVRSLKALQAIHSEQKHAAR